MPDQAIQRIFDRWWCRLHDADGTPPQPDRAQLARLRRIDLVETERGPRPDFCSAVEEPAFRDLYRRIEPRLRLPLDDWEDDLVTAAVTLARIRDRRRGGWTAALLRGEGDRPLLSESRFIRLMRVETTAELFDQARRLAQLLGATPVPVGELGESLLLWRHRSRIRRDWARHYYALDTASPEDSPAAAEPALDPGA